MFARNESNSRDMEIREKRRWLIQDATYVMASLEGSGANGTN